MSPMTGDAPKTTRAFIALDLPEQVRSGVGAWGDAALDDPALRSLAPASLHITLAFLGDLDDVDLKRAAEVIYEADPGPVRIWFEPEATGMPREKRRRKRLFVLGCRSPAAVALQADVEAKLVETGIFEPERQFWPHVTVARVRAARDGPGRKEPVRKPPGRLSGELLEPFHAVRLTLYLSKTKSAGAGYAPLAQVELPRGTPNGQQ